MIIYHKYFLKAWLRYGTQWWHKLYSPMHQASGFPFAYGYSPLASEQHPSRWWVIASDIYSAEPRGAEGSFVAAVTYGGSQKTHEALYSQPWGRRQQIPNHWRLLPRSERRDAKVLSLKCPSEFRQPGNIFPGWGWVGLSNARFLVLLKTLPPEPVDCLSAGQEKVWFEAEQTGTLRKEFRISRVWRGCKQD